MTNKHGDLHTVDRKKPRANADARRFHQQDVELVIKHPSMHVAGY